MNVFKETPPPPAPEVRPRRYFSLSGVWVMVAFFALALICPAVLYVGVDFVCAGEAQKWTPYYPESVVIEEDYNVFRPFGVGVTTVVLESADDQRVVRQWYETVRGQNNPDDLNRILSALRYTVRPTDDGKTRITITSECAWY